MSTKQFISAEEHLAKLGVTVQQAQDFIVENVGDPELLFNTARLNGVTSGMLSEIMNISTDIIQDYFTDADLPSIELDYTSLLINSDLGALEPLVNFNTNTGLLSNASLRETVQLLLESPNPQMVDNPNRYDDFFGPAYSYSLNDGIYDAEELGVGHLKDVPATNESIESIFYGTLINLFSRLDETELNQINAFSEDSDPEEFQMLLIESLESPDTVIRSDSFLGGLVVQEAEDIINKFWEPGSDLVGVLDHSLLGIATA